jgi:glycosyltransferase involved in cell wall biosynthesis
MKIAFLNDLIYKYASSEPSAVGGSERQQWLLARALAASGWTACVGIRQGLRGGERRVIEGVEFHGIAKGHYLLDWHRFLKSERPHWLYWRAATHLLGPLIQIAHLNAVRTIFATAFDSDVHPRSALTARRRWWPLYLWGLSRTERLFVQHEGQLEQLPSRWRGKTTVMRSIADKYDGFTTHSAREPYVAWVGMLRKPKRPDLLIEIARRSPQIKYVVCGGSTSHRSAPAYSQEIIDQFRLLRNIDYRGQVEPRKAEEVIANAALLLCTSEQEGFPNTFLQAWGHGTPVVTMQVDPESVIKRLNLGAVTHTVEATVEQVHRLVKLPGERQKMGQGSMEYILNNHRSEVIVQAFDSVTNQSSGS